MLMDIRVIRSDEDYQWALKEVEQYFDAPPKKGTPEAERFDLLTQLVEDYDRQHFAIGDVDPIEVLETVMEDRGLTQNDLATVLNSRSHASEILNRKRKLSIAMIRAINEAWAIPVDALIGEYELEKTHA